jgi:hypothetical protein
LCVSGQATTQCNRHPFEKQTKQTKPKKTSWHKTPPVGSAGDQEANKTRHATTKKEEKGSSNECLRLACPGVPRHQPQPTAQPLGTPTQPEEITQSTKDQIGQAACCTYVPNAQSASGTGTSGSVVATACHGRPIGRSIRSPREEHELSPPPPPAAAAAASAAAAGLARAHRKATALRRMVEEKETKTQQKQIKKKKKKRERAFFFPFFYYFFIFFDYFFFSPFWILIF